MFRYIFKKLKFIFSKNESESYKESESSKETAPLPDLSTKLKDNLDNIRNSLGSSPDIIYREFSFGKHMEVKAALIYLDGLVNKSTVNEFIMKPFMYDSKFRNMESEFEVKNINIIKSSMIAVGEIKQAASIREIIDGCLSGDTIFLVEGNKEALIIHSREWETRTVEEPKTEAVVRGPREGFIEAINTNMSLLRRKIKNPNLTFETMVVGKQTRTTICMAYIKGIVNSKLIGEIKKRLNGINTDSILESGYIEQFIEDNPFSIFPGIGNCEKPDTAAAKILEGRVAILIDGTPFVLTVPFLFLEGFQSAEDYYSRPFFASIIRIIRFLSFGVTVLAPATYVILSTFHQELIPTTLLFTMAAGREGVPFPSGMEATFMVITFEILREAGVRLPRPVGQAVSIVGALVIGEAAVSAGLVGGLMIIVMAGTAVSSFVVPVYTDVGAILRVVFLLLGSVLGIFGVAVGLLGVLIHLVSLRSFGTPYFAPVAPFIPQEMKDTFMRFPLWTMVKRPKSITWNDSVRHGKGLKPEPPTEEGGNSE